MSWSNPTLRTLQRLRTLQNLLKQLFTDRDTAVDLLVLAALCQEHLLLLGPPGTAKTELLSRFTNLVDARGFHYLLTRFTEPSEIFGPLDLERFQKGTFHIRTAGMLPEAQIVFLDEVFQGSSAILNSLLTLINERIFHNGSERQTVPLVSLVGASNSLPDDPWLRAFADRFTLRLEVQPVADERLDELLDAGWQIELARIEAARLAAAGDGARELPELKLDDLLALHQRLAEVVLSEVRPLYAQVLRELRAEGVEITDRRVVKGLKLVAGATLLREAAKAEARDLWPLLHVWSRPDEVPAVRGVVQPRVEEGGGAVLDRIRPAADILLDLEVLEQRQPAVRTEVALGAHLMALNRLRREAIADHRGDSDLRHRIESVIQRALERMGAREQMEEAHV